MRIEMTPWPAEPEEQLTGGNMTPVVRIGNTVHREAGPWTPTIHRLLEHLLAGGIEGIPRPAGMDASGREVLSYLAGTVPQYPLPAWVWGDDVLVAAVRRLVDLHEASAGFDLTGAQWQLPAHQPVEVICHNDFAPHNLVFDGTRLIGVIDWDTASPGPRIWDLAGLAYRLIPLTDPSDEPSADSSDGRDLAQMRRRVALLCASYGPAVTPHAVLLAAILRLDDLADFTEARARQGATHLHSHVTLYRHDAAWIGAHLTDLTEPR